MTAALEPCPNPECEWSDPQSEYHGRSVWCECQTCGTRAAYVGVESDTADDWTAATAEARRLWNLLPRAPRWTSEPPTAAGYYWNKVGGGEPYVTEFLPRDVGEPNIRGVLIAGPIPEPPSPAERSE